MNQNQVVVAGFPKMPGKAKGNRRSPVFLNGFSVFFLLLFTAYHAGAQHPAAINNGEAAICEIDLTGVLEKGGKLSSAGARRNIDLDKTSPKQFKLEANEFGYFNRIANIRPHQRIPIAISYPQGSEGEKVAILVQDGGTLDNEKKTKVAELNRFKRIVFAFRVTDNLGLYRIMLRKGDDTKIIQLWVGKEPTPVEQ